MNRKAIKDFLLAEDLCTDNKYLDAYLDLVEVNLMREADTKSTQGHHAIPVSYYKRRDNCSTRYAAKKLAETDPLNVVVNLLYSDHLLAHAYLALCAKSEWFKYANTNIFGNFVNFEISESLIELLNSKEFQERYEEGHSLRIANSSGANNGFYGRHLSEEHKEKIRNTKKLRRELGLYQQELRSAEFREQVGASKRGKLYVSTADGTQSKLISPEALPDYLANGWVRGFALNGKAHLGKKMSEATKQKMSASQKGKGTVPVECIELNKIFSSVSEAAKELNIRPNAISNCLIGKCKTSGGYHWRYAK